MGRTVSYQEQQRAVGRVMRDLRLEAGIRQEELARRMGRPQSFVSKYESGERRLTFVDVLTISDGLGVAIADVAARFRSAVP